MTIVDDIRRDITGDDYQQVKHDFITEFAGRGYGLYQYGGGKNPPVSDLDLLVLVSPRARASNVRRLHRDLAAFRSRSAVRQYVIDEEVRICPVDLFEQINYVHPRIVPEGLQALDGQKVLIVDPEPSRLWSGVTLVDRLLVELNELDEFARAERIQLRPLISALRKMPRPTFELLRRVGAGHGWADEQLLNQSWPLERSIDAFCARHGGPDAQNAPDETEIADLLHSVVGFLDSEITAVSDAFLGTVIRSERALDARRIPFMGRSLVPGLAIAHMSLHDVAANRSSMFGEKLRGFAGGATGIIGEPEYLALLARRMEVVAKIEHRFSRFGLPGFPVCIAGLWDTAMPRGFIDRWWARMPRRLSSPRGAIA
jgi:hypothetical protein